MSKEHLSKAIEEAVRSAVLSYSEPVLPSAPTLPGVHVDEKGFPRSLDPARPLPPFPGTRPPPSPNPQRPRKEASKHFRPASRPLNQPNLAVQTQTQTQPQPPKPPKPARPFNPHGQITLSLDPEGRNISQCWQTFFALNHIHHLQGRPDLIRTDQEILQLMIELFPDKAAARIRIASRMRNYVDRQRKVFNRGDLPGQPAPPPQPSLMYIRTLTPEGRVFVISPSGRRLEEVKPAPAPAPAAEGTSSPPE